jgi:putative transposase
MIRRKAYRFRLGPDAAQRNALSRFAGSCRFVWNRALAEQKARLERGQRSAGFAGMCRWLTNWRGHEVTTWLAETDVPPLQQRLKDLDRAICDSFRKGSDVACKKFPRFNKPGNGNGFRYPCSVKIDASRPGWARAWLPEIGWIHDRASRPVESKICQATISERCGHGFVSIQTEREIVDPLSRSAPAVGIDIGVTQFATCSDRTVFEPLNASKRLAKRLRRAQRTLSRKRRGSANRKKQQRRVAKLGARAAQARKDHLHKASSLIANKTGVVVTEDLAVTAMSASAKGSAEQPGRYVQAKAGRNRAILDQGWFAFRSMLGWKLAERGRNLILVDPRNTSRRCRVCGHAAAANRPTQAAFVCVWCGYREHADLKAAKNILAAGLAASALSVEGHRDLRPGEAGTSRRAA